MPRDAADDELPRGSGSGSGGVDGAVASKWGTGLSRLSRHGATTTTANGVTANASSRPQQHGAALTSMMRRYLVPWLGWLAAALLALHNLNSGGSLAYLPEGSLAGSDSGSGGGPAGASRARRTGVAGDGGAPHVGNAGVVEQQQQQQQHQAVAAKASSARTWSTSVARRFGLGGADAGELPHHDMILVIFTPDTEEGATTRAAMRDIYGKYNGEVLDNPKPDTVCVAKCSTAMHV